MRTIKLLIGVTLLGSCGVALRAAEMVAATSFNSVHVYPNPWRADRHAHFPVTFDGLPPQATVRLYSLSGHQVKTLVSDADGKAVWDRTNQDGARVASGLYLYKASYSDSKPIVGKLALIR